MWCANIWCEIKNYYRLNYKANGSFSTENIEIFKCVNSSLDGIKVQPYLCFFSLKKNFFPVFFRNKIFVKKDSNKPIIIIWFALAIIIFIISLVI